MKPNNLYLLVRKQLNFGVRDRLHDSLERPLAVTIFEIFHVKMNIQLSRLITAVINETKSDLDETN